MARGASEQLVLVSLFRFMATLRPSVFLMSILGSLLPYYWQNSSPPGSRFDAVGCVVLALRNGD